MNRLVRSAFAVVLLAGAPALAAPSTYEIDASHSSASFSVRHMMVTNVRGQFGKVSGTVTVDGKDWSKAKVEAVIDATTIDTRDPKRDGHLKSADFFDVEKHPTITFKSTKIEKSGNGYKMTGDLTMRGVTKSVVFDVEGPTPEMKDPWGNVKVGAMAMAKVNRKDFGLTWNKAIEGGMLVGDEVSILLDVELGKKAEMPAPAAAKTDGTNKTPPGKQPPAKGKAK
jgi:polyisoprenoid-binding protein YceI